MKLISEGAEAKIYLDKDTIIKKRIEKPYRIKEIDNSLRKSRTRREAKILSKLKNISSPYLIDIDDKEMNIKMSYIPGKKVRDILDKNTKIAQDIGKAIAHMHDQDIIHGDLTTSNMIYNDKLYLIDFGLSYFSTKIEDKAVDLHLLKQALDSKHYKVSKKTFSLVLKGYKISKNYEETIKRLEIVENRGRNKTKG